MHSREIRDSLIKIEIKTKLDPYNQKKEIKKYLVKLITEHPESIGSLEKVINRLYPEYKSMLEKIHLLK